MSNLSFPLAQILLISPSDYALLVLFVDCEEFSIDPILEIPYLHGHTSVCNCKNNTKLVRAESLAVRLNLSWLLLLVFQEENISQAKYVWYS